MFESTGEMVIVLILFVVGIFPFVYLPWKAKKQKQEQEQAPLREVPSGPQQPQDASGRKRRPKGGRRAAGIPRARPM